MYFKCWFLVVFSKTFCVLFFDLSVLFLCFNGVFFLLSLHCNYFFLYSEPIDAGKSLEIEHPILFSVSKLCLSFKLSRTQYIQFVDNSFHVVNFRSEL